MTNTTTWLSVRVKLLFPLAVLGVVLSWFTSFTIERTSSREVEKNTLSSAEAYAKRTAALRTYYTKNVVRRASAGGNQFSHDYADRAGVLPLPATMIHELNALQHDGMQTRLFSDTPFPWRRATGGLRDEAVRSACRHLGGAVQVLSSANDGTRFRFEFPAVDGMSLTAT